jgi:hypothetical protein
MKHKGLEGLVPRDRRRAARVGLVVLGIGGGMLLERVVDGRETDCYMTSVMRGDVRVEGIVSRERDSSVFTVGRGGFAWPVSFAGTAPATGTLVVVHGRMRRDGIVADSVMTP